MPMYDFKCCKCGEEKEIIVKNAEVVLACTCGYLMTKEVAKPNFRLEGSCWEKDGYK